MPGAISTQPCPRRRTREKDPARYADAEPLHKRALTILEKSAGLDEQSEGAP